VRTSDLSLSGCYVDTLNPFPTGAILHLWIHKENESLQADTIVRTQHLGSGMGLAFTDLLTEGASTVRRWLFEPDPNHVRFLPKKKDKHMSQVYDALRKAEQSRKATLNPEEPIPVVQNPVSLAQGLAEGAATVFGPGLHIRGEISGSESLLVEGQVDGLISIGDCRLTVGPNAQVSAQILAGEVVVHGTVDGEVCASKRIEILSTATVSGELTAPRIMIEEGATVNASVQVGNEIPSVPSSESTAIAANS
jgi:cytoskeletal protein CcmA (bactofilin family)